MFIFCKNCNEVLCCYKDENYISIGTIFEYDKKEMYFKLMCENCNFQVGVKCCKTCKHCLDNEILNLKTYEEWISLYKEIVLFTTNSCCDICKNKNFISKIIYFNNKIIIEEI